MSSQTRRAREKAGVQERILDAARELFVREGYDAVSMRKIARAIEYTPAALYVHFADKSELMRAMCRRDFGAMAAAFARLARVADPVERIERAGQLYVRMAVEQPNQYRLMFMTPPPADLEMSEEDLAHKGNPEQDAYAFMRQACAEAIAAGRIGEGVADADLLAQTLWAGLHGVVTLFITHGDDPCVNLRPVRTRARVMMAAMLRGLLTDAGAPGAGGSRRGARAGGRANGGLNGAANGHEAGHEAGQGAGRGGGRAGGRS